MEIDKLNDIAECMDCLMNGWQYYLNKKIGEILELEDEYIAID